MSTQPKTIFVGFRITVRQEETLCTLAQRSGLSLSGVIRALIDNAELVPTEQVVSVVRLAGIEGKGNG